MSVLKYSSKRTLQRLALPGRMRTTLMALALLAVIGGVATASRGSAITADPQNTGAAAPTEPAAQTGALQPASTLGSADLIAQYRQRLAANPSDRDALEGLARAEVELKNFPAAIAAYRQVLESNPGDRSAQIQLARLLGWNRQYDESMRTFRAVLDQDPGDREALEGLANVQVWSNKLEDAAATYAKLAAANPGDTSYLFEAARLEAGLHQYASARSRLTSLLAVEPDNLDARLLLAQLELKQEQSASALRQFERVLAQRPADLEALEGAARAHYYLGDLGQAYELASRLVEQQPGNFDALFLLASIERARGQRYQARLLLNRADRISPHNPDVKELREKVWQESSTVLHLTAAYNREITSPEPGVPPSEVVEDLRTFAFGSRLDFVRLPRTTSSFLFDSLPVETPLGFYGGAAAPYEFLYQQTTHVFSKLALRGGIGFQHFGPGVPVNLPNGAGPQPSATSAVVGFGGGTFALTRHVSFDLTWSRSGITYTPLAVRLGVISSRTEEGLGVAFDPRTTLHLTYFQERLTTEPYTQVVSTGTTGNPMTVTSSEYENGSGGTAVFSRLIVNRERLVLDVGGSALLFGYDGPRRGVFLGFFTPSFYQRELFDSRVKGRLSKTFGYDVSASFGVQQVNQGQPIKHALILSPGFTFKLTPYLSGSIGYTHYDAAQSLGLVQGNGVHLGIDWRF